MVLSLLLVSLAAAALIPCPPGSPCPVEEPAPKPHYPMGVIAWGSGSLTTIAVSSVWPGKVQGSIGIAAGAITMAVGMLSLAEATTSPTTTTTTAAYERRAARWISAAALGAGVGAILLGARAIRRKSTASGDSVARTASNRQLELVPFAVLGGGERSLLGIAVKLRFP